MKEKSTKTRTIRVDALARVEGEGGITVKIKNGAVVDVKLNIFEPPRFFEAFLRGRSCEEAPGITSRICGICPIAYQMSTVHAVEDALGLKVDGQLRALRRLIYCGEWIESHALHVYLLHAPDFLGYADGIQMAKDHPGILQRGLKLKKAGNELIRFLGGREIHPINIRVGGFYKAPSKKSLCALEEQLKWAREAALETVRWAASLPFPGFEQDFLFVALRHEAEYPFNEGRIVSNRGLDIPVHDYEQLFSEQHIPYSTALHSALKGHDSYFVGPLARYNLNFDRLSPMAREAALAAGLQSVCKNPFQSIVVRSVEILYACDEALRIIEQYEMPEKPAVEYKLKAGTGYACTEAPRGILYHRFRFDDHGSILDAKIVPPTSQNQKVIENDLRQFVPGNISLPEEELRRQCEQVVRNYDPCISCSTHFLKLRMERE
jgi:coenzyme F420-reducing hydrogenase alpha subunit